MFIIYPIEWNAVDTRDYYSNWWYGISIPIFKAIGWLVVIPFLEQQTLQTLPLSGIAILSGGFLIITSVFLTPAFVCCLWLDARKLSRSDAPWSPNHWLWGSMGGIAILVGFLFSYLWPEVFISLTYLFRRYRRIGLFGDTAVTLEQQVG